MNLNVFGLHSKRDLYFQLQSLTKSDVNREDTDSVFTFWWESHDYWYEETNLEYMYLHIPKMEGKKKNLMKSTFSTIFFY